MKESRHTEQSEMTSLLGAKCEGWGEGGAGEKFRVQVMENLEIFPKPILEPLVELSWEWDDYIGLLVRDPPNDG